MQHKYDIEVFKTETDIFYYLLGAFMTDGCVYQPKHCPTSKVISLVSKDLDWLESINKLICPNKNINKTGKNCFLLQYTNKELGDILISRGCIPRKSLTMKFPKVPEKFLPDFIRGCWDGDGSISFNLHKKGTYYLIKSSFNSGSKSFTESMSKILNDRGIKNKIYCRKLPNRLINGRLVTSSTENYRIQLSSAQSTYNFIKYVYYTDHKLSMIRKNNTAQNIILYWESPIYCKDCGICLRSMTDIRTTNDRKIKRCKKCQKTNCNNRNKLRYYNNMKNNATRLVS